MDILKVRQSADWNELDKANGIMIIRQRSKQKGKQVESKGLKFVCLGYL